MAIIAIVFHNYFHWLYGATKENEFVFSLDNFTNMLIAIRENYWEIIHAFFTYFGHFGVVVFIFISAYGLAKSQPDVDFHFSFVITRFKKIYPSLLIALLMWLIFFGRKQGLIMGPIEYFWEHFDSISYLLLGISNLIPCYAMKLVGPWWFIPFILQFYILFPLLTRLLNKYSFAALLLSLLGLLANIVNCTPSLGQYEIRSYFLFYNSYKMRNRIMSRKRRNHSSYFKAKVAMAAIKGDETLSELARRYNINANLCEMEKTVAG